MIHLTEEEAREKWCPFTRITAGNLRDSAEWHTNRPGFKETGDANFDRCCASDCMAWRLSVDWGGYCGLAGKPGQ